MKERTENERQKFNKQIEKDRAERKIAAKKRPNRSSESLRSRYQDYLSNIGEAEMKKIVSWV